MAANPILTLLALHAAGRFAEMERGAKQALERTPDAPVLEELLGMALSAQGRHPEAITHLKRAAKLQPSDPQFFENLGLCQRSLGQLDSAEKSFRRSLALRPNAPDAMNALGSVVSELGRKDEAANYFEQAISFCPDMIAAWLNLTKVRVEQQRYEVADAILKKINVRNPAVADAHVFLSRALMHEGNFSSAEYHLRKAMEIDVRNFNARMNLAVLYFDLMLFPQAAEAAETALRLLGGSDVAITANNANNIEGIANILAQGGKRSLAGNLFRRLLAVAPNDDRLVWAFSLARACCDWAWAEELEPLLSQAKNASRSADVFSYIISEKMTAADQLARCKAVAQPVVVKAVAPSKRSTKPADRIRIGYLSGDFRDHAISHLIAGIIENHDRHAFEVRAYDFSPRDGSGYRLRMEVAFDHMVDIWQVSDRAAAQIIADDGTDILIDLAGWTRGARPEILAARPAPIQIYWLGVAGTTGAPWIDYNIADRVVIPERLEPFFSEKIIRLPDTYLPADRLKWSGDARSRTESGLPESGVVFCSFSSSFKITRTIFDIWLRLLSEVPGSILWISQLPAEVDRALRTRASERGIHPDRIIAAPRTESLSEHIARACCADIALDTFPYGSHTTASDMILAGLPLVALTGETFASRVSASVLGAAGLSEFATQSLDEYFALALKLAADPAALESAKARARNARSSVLFDAPRFTRNIEAAFRMAIERQRQNLPPATFEVPQS